MRKNISLLSFVCLPLLACGGSDSNSKSVKVVDAKTFLDASGSGSGGCKAPASYAVTSFPKTFVTDHPPAGSDSHYQVIQGLVGSTGSGSTGTLDILTLVLSQGSGSTMFASGIKSGTYTIDPTTDFSIELLLWPQLPASTSGPIPAAYLASEQYLAVAGSLTLTAEGGIGSAVSGSLTDLNLVHVDDASGTFTSANDDGSGNPCTTTIANLSFSGSAAAPMSPHTQGETPIGTFQVPSLQHRFLRNAH